MVEGVDFDEEDEEGGGGGCKKGKGKGRGPKTANEVDEEEAAAAVQWGGGEDEEEEEGDGAVGDGEEVVPCGRVLSVLSKEGGQGGGAIKVVVQSAEGGGGQPLDEGSVLCLLLLSTGRRVVLGRVGEVFGPVACPCYVVRPRKALLSHARGGGAGGEERGEGEEEEERVEVATGMAVGYIKGRAGFVVPQALMSKGTDASNIHDEELPPDGAWED